MGEVGNFLFGGSSQKEQGQNSSQQQSSSSEQSQSNSVQAAASGSSNSNRSGGAEWNQAYGPISAAMTPALGYVTAAGDMMSALLGLPTGTFSYEQDPFAPGDILPPMDATTSAPPPLPPLDEIVESLASSEPTMPPPAPTPAPAPGTAPPPTTTPPPAPPPPSTFDPSVPDAIQANALGLANTSRNLTGIPAQGISFLAGGGPVSAGQPVVVGETQPEVFVPQTPGYVLPSAGGRGRRNSDWRTMLMNRMASRFGGAPLPGSSLNPAPTGSMSVPLPGTTSTPAPTVTPAPATTSTPAPTSATPASASSGLENWSDSAGMNFILDQGQKAISGASAANGVFNSGATGKALVEYGQGLGQTYLNQYMQHLASLGQLGLGAGSAMSNAGSVGVNQTAGGGSSSSVSGGLSSSSGSSSTNSSGTSQGTTSGSGNSKKGLVPSVASLVAASDRKLKTNITLLYREADGLGRYEWNWKSDPNGQRVQGVIADEVAVLRPEAYVPGFVNGEYDGVDYARL